MQADRLWYGMQLRYFVHPSHLIQFWSGPATVRCGTLPPSLPVQLRLRMLVFLSLLNPMIVFAC